MAFVNGQWFNGTGFQRGTFYAVDGILRASKPADFVETVDLHDGLVVAAFGDAHNHSPSSNEDLTTANRAFLDAGVFYVLNAGGNAEPANAIRPHLGTPATIDMIFAHGLFTSPGGHPGPYLENLVDRGILPFDKAYLEGHFFYGVDTGQQLEKVWPQYLATKPDFVKLVFVFSELYQSANAGQKSLGLRPDIAKEIVHRARVAGLRSGAHIESAEDFRNAVESGVDMVMHLPCFPDPLDRQSAYRNKSNWEERYTIPLPVISLTAQRQVTVVTTAAACSAEDFEKPHTFVDMTENEKRFRKIMIENIRHLKDAGVTLVVGSDTQPGTGALTEIRFLKETGIFSNLELLKMWSEATPKAIFPQRNVGVLKEGYEANFLVLDGNPIQDFEAVKRIKMRVKQGEPTN